MIGVIVELLGTTLSVCGLNGQKHALMRAEIMTSETMCENWRWAVAFCVFVLGQITEVVAQAFGTQALVASVSNVSLCTNAMIARFAFREYLSFKDFGAIGVILIGTALASFSAPKLPSGSDDYDVKKLLHLARETAYLIFFCASLVTIAIALLLVLRLPPREKQTSNVGAYLYAILAATNGSIVVTLSSIFMKLLRNTWDGNDQFGDSDTWFILVGFISCAALNLIFLNKGMKDYESMVMIPLYYTLNTILSVIAGLLYYDTFREFDRVTMPCFVCGTLLSLLGIVVLAGRERDSDDAIERWRQQTAELGDRISNSLQRLSANANTPNLTRALLHSTTTDQSGRRATTTSAPSSLRPVRSTEAPASALGYAHVVMDERKEGGADMEERGEDEVLKGKRNRKRSNSWSVDSSTSVSDSSVSPTKSSRSNESAEEEK